MTAPLTLTLSCFKSFVNADDSTVDDNLLAGLLSSARVAVLGMINCTEDEICAEYGGEIPEDLVWAILAYGADLYDKREGSSASNYELTPTFHATIMRYRKFDSL